MPIPTSKKFSKCLILSFLMLLIGCTKTVTEVETLPPTTATLAEAATTTTIAPGAAEALAYFDAFAEDSGIGFKRMSTLSEPLSPAWSYAYHQERLSIANTQDGYATSESKTEIVGEEIVLCNGINCASDTNYSDFIFSDDLLQSFSIDGRKLDDLVEVWPFSEQHDCVAIKPNPCDSDKSIDIYFRSFYRTARNDVFVSFDWIRGASSDGSLRSKSAFLEVDGVRYESSGESTPVPDVGKFNVGYFSFSNPPSGAAKIFFSLSWWGETFEFVFDIGRI